MIHSAAALLFTYVPANSLFTTKNPLIINDIFVMYNISPFRRQEFFRELLPTGGKNTRNQAAKLVRGESVQPKRFQK